MQVPRKLKIVQIDHNGYCGRNFHPDDEDIGLIVEVTSIEISLDEVCFICKTEDSRTLELMEHEVKFVQ